MKATGQEAGDGARYRVTLGGENFYLMAFIENGVPSIAATVPYENRPDKADLRQIVETLCQTANEALAALTRKGGEA